MELRKAETFVIFDINKTVICNDAAGGKSQFQGITAAVLERERLDGIDFLAFIKPEIIIRQLEIIYPNKNFDQSAAVQMLNPKLYQFGNLYDNIRHFCHNFYYILEMTKLLLWLNKHPQ